MELTFIEHAEDQGFTIIELIGDIDVYNAPKLRRRIIDLIEAGRYRLIIDMTRVEFLDSTGLGVLVDGLKRMRAHDGWIGLVAPRRSILRIFRTAGIGRLFSTYDSLADAIAAHAGEAFADAIATRTTTAIADVDSTLTSAAIADVIDAFTSMLDSETTRESSAHGTTNSTSTGMERIPVSIYLVKVKFTPKSRQRWSDGYLPQMFLYTRATIGSWFRRLEASVEKSAAHP